MKVIVVGAGWAGCAAALSVRKQDADVLLLERTDMLLGTGLVGGIMRNNGRYTSTEEMIAMGGGEMFQLTDQNSLHRDMEFPGHFHLSLYNEASMEPVVKSEITEPTAIGAGIEVLELEAVPLQSEPLRARRVIVRLGSARVVFQYTNLRIRTRATLGPGLVVYTAFSPQAQGTFNGLPIRPGLILSASEGTVVVLVVEAGYQCVVCLLSPEDIR